MAENSQNFKKNSFVQEFERVPPCYKEVEKVLNQVKACKGNVKTIIYNSRLRGALFKKVYSLVTNVLKYRRILEKVIEDTDLLTKEPFLRKEFAGILIYEIIFGKGLPGESRPVLAIRKHEKEIRGAYDVAKKDVKFSSTGLPSLPRYARVNTIATSVTAVLEDLRNNGAQQVHYDKNTSLDGYMNLVKNLQVGYFLIDFHFKDLLVFASKENLPSWHLHQKGHIFIQDKSSYIPVHVLNPEPGCTVLDACAAPGMKTVHIAASMKNEGQIYAYERDKERFETLKTTLDFSNVQICEAECEDFYLVNTNDPKFRSLEYILVDPSCSGSGMVSRMDSVTDTEDSKSKHRLQKLAGFQILLLKHALLFPSVKRVVYSTCSITEEENEFVVHEVLNSYGNRFKLVSVMPDWPIRGSDNFEYGHLCLRAYPDVSLTNGFFVAMFERLEYDQYGHDNLNSNTQSSKKNKNKKKCDYGNFEVSNSGQKEDDYLGSYNEERNFDETYDNDYTNQNLSNLNDTVSEVRDENNHEGNVVGKKHKKKKHHDTVPNNNFDNVIEFKVETDTKANSAKKKRHHSESQDTILEENTNDVRELISEVNAENILENDVMKKKHKKKRRHDESQDTILEENTNNIREHLTEVNAENVSEDNVMKKKHKKKKAHSKDREISPNESFNDTVELKVENELECNTMKKKHKRKRRRSEDQEIIMEVKVENDVEYKKDSPNKKVKEINSITDETVDGPSDRVLTKKDKKKKYNDSIEVNDFNSTLDFTGHKKSKCHVYADNSTNSETCLEITSETDLQSNETQIKKKHKKRCKNKKNREE